jgi:hypothetical protein
MQCRKTSSLRSTVPPQAVSLPRRQRRRGDGPIQAYIQADNAVPAVKMSQEINKVGHRSTQVQVQQVRATGGLRFQPRVIGMRQPS